jgi:hypothetical protein
LQRLRTTKQFHVYGVIIYNQTSADYGFTFDAHIQADSRRWKRLLLGTRSALLPNRNLLWFTERQCTMCRISPSPKNPLCMPLHTSNRTFVQRQDWAVG